ncbi:Sporozoite surface protein 2 [Senna tora]|uniref:Sporozoite surface protein 2 n=1 Tax=Senna tora TaxID=362788 RepID=A0A834XES6_9FABA|nr:Sporozoite surface protein 2 [Senna tora]
MLEMRGVDENAYKHLLDISPKLWSKSRFNTTQHCDALLNNMSETFNSVIVDLREKPILTMLEAIREYLMNRWADCRRKITTHQESVLPRIKARLEKQKKECSCRAWMLTGIPCCHSIAAMNFMRKTPDDYIPACFRKEKGQGGLRKGEERPLMRKKTRPKRRRLLPQASGGKRKKKVAATVSKSGLNQKCTKCGIIGYNKRKCTGEPHPSTIFVTPLSRKCKREMEGRRWLCSWQPPVSTRRRSTMVMAVSATSSGVAQVWM